LGGLGDSPAADPARENDPYTPTAFRDIDRAVREIAATRGAGGTVLLGLCSGAYAAFQSAAQLKTSVLLGSILINPLTYHWTEGMSLGTSPTAEVKEIHYYVNAAYNPRNWLRLMTGKSTIGIGKAARIFMRRWWLAIRSLRRPQSNRLDPRSGDPSHPDRENVAGDLDRIGRARRTLAFVFADTDPGLLILKVLAGRAVSRLRRSRELDMFLIEKADHTFTSRRARRTLVQTIVRYLQERFSHPDCMRRGTAEHHSVRKPTLPKAG
jgi:hypothetical protein